MTEPIALPVQRHPRQTLHQVWAPKLGRALMFTSLEQLHLWVMLQAHPGVSRYCERPSSGDLHNPCPDVDFWAMREGVPTWLRLQCDDIEPAEQLIESITAEELGRHRYRITNWLSLLPYLSFRPMLAC